ncbi:hypothetical protein V8324_20775, partial [Roseovarius sp. D22-M7]
MTDWTTGRVQDRLELAADVFAQLPAVKPTGYFNAWPEYFVSASWAPRAFQLDVWKFQGRSSSIRFFGWP